MKLNLKERKGITLIALVITIIVLLILAGVSIAMLTGQNGILTQANNAKDETEQANAKEKVELAVIATMSQSKRGTLDADKLVTEITNHYGGTATKTGTGFPVNTTVDGKSFTVSSTGEVTATGDSTPNPPVPTPTDVISAKNIADMDDKTNIYGATVTNYTPATSTDVKWKIFYADNDNIYLIADNYVERTNLPNSTNGTTATANKPNDGSSSYARTANFTNILGDYAGSARITDSRLKALNNDYFNTKGFSSTNNNMKSVAYMMDTTAWNSKFKDTNNKADYVIGGPSVELLFKSYNAKYKTAFESQAVESSDKRNTGYQIRKTSSDSWANYVSSMLSTSDPLYVITAQSNALAYWLASPSANDADFVLSAYYYGGVGDSDYRYDSSGFRPLVCLQAGVKLQKVSDKQYTIQ